MSNAPTLTHDILEMHDRMARKRLDLVKTASQLDGADDVDERDMAIVAIEALDSGIELAEIVLGIKSSAGPVTPTD